MIQDYRRRVVHAMQDYGMTKQAEAPADRRIVYG